MVYASFGKVRNDTGTSVLTANLVRDGQIIKSYSTTTSAVRFEKIPEFLVRSSQEPNLVQRHSADGKDHCWRGMVRIGN